MFQISRQKQDVVVDSFLQTVQNITNSATQELREKLFRARKQRRSELRSFVQIIQMDIFQPFLVVDQIVASEELAPDKKLSEIKTILLDFHESRQAVERQISEMLEDTDSSVGDFEFYNVPKAKISDSAKAKPPI